MDALTTADLLRPVLTDLAGVMDGLDTDSFDAATPCTELDVAGLRHHVLAWLTTFAAGYSDGEGRAPMSELASFAPPVDGAGAVRSAADRLDSAIRAGAGDRPLWLGDSAMPGDLALSMILWEYLVHGWDLARATGQPWRPAEAAVQAAYAFAPGMLTPDYQGAGKPFGPPVEVGDDADVLDRLVALSGRSPDWSPPAAGDGLLSGPRPVR